MKAVETSESNLTLTLAGAGPDRNLPAQRILAFDPGLGETEADGRPAIETCWVPDEGERRALANGAPLELIVFGEQHPPVSVGVGEPQELNALVSKAHVDRAVGYWFAKQAGRLARGEGFPTAPELLELWHEALEETRDEERTPDLAEEIETISKQIQREHPDLYVKGGGEDGDHA
jgi:hypothetical protein